jgi:hypothetical protein
VYNKLFSKILDSSTWLESHATRIVWFTFLAAMDQDGMCEFASPLNVAHRARVTPEEAEAALAILEAPDKYSSDTDREGRRIERVAGGWIVLNARKYRAITTAADRREKTRERVRKHRARAHGEGDAPASDPSPAVDCNAESVTRNAPVTTSEAETTSEANEKKKAGAARGKSEKPPSARDKRERPVHPLFGEVRDLVFRYYRHCNGSVDPEWGGREGKSLSDLLAANPQATIDHWTRCMTGRSRSDVNHAERPALWLPRLSSFREPVDAYGRPKTLSNENGGKTTHGTSRESAQQRQQRIDDETRASYARLAPQMGVSQAADDGVSEARP